MPASRHFWRSPAMALAVMATIGTRGGLALLLELAPAAGGAVAVQHRHLAVHQHQVEAADFHFLQRHLAVAGGVAVGAQHLQQALRHHQVHRVVLDQQDPRHAFRVAASGVLAVGAGVLVVAWPRHAGCRQHRAQVGASDMRGISVRRDRQVRWRGGVVATQVDQARSRRTGSCGPGCGAAPRRCCGCCPGRPAPSNTTSGSPLRRWPVRRRSSASWVFSTAVSRRPQLGSSRVRRWRRRGSVVSSSTRAPCSSSGCAGMSPGDLDQRDLEPEGRAAAGLGVHADAAAHQVDDALADRQAQAGAAVQAGGGGVGLAEGQEQLLGAGSMPMPVSLHLEAQLVLGGGLAQALDVQGDRCRAR